MTDAEIEIEVGLLRLDNANLRRMLQEAMDALKASNARVTEALDVAQRTMALYESTKQIAEEAQVIAKKTLRIPSTADFIYESLLGKLRGKVS